MIKLPYHTEKFYDDCWKTPKNHVTIDILHHAENFYDDECRKITEKKAPALDTGIIFTYKNKKHVFPFIHPIECKNKRVYATDRSITITSKQYSLNVTLTPGTQLPEKLLDTLIFESPKEITSYFVGDARSGRVHIYMYNNNGIITANTPQKEFSSDFEILPDGRIHCELPRLFGRGLHLR